MSIVLPTWPGPSNAEPTYLDYGTQLDAGPHGGGPRVGRLGNRFSLAISMPAIRLGPMKLWGVGARVFLSRLRQAVDQGAIFKFPQPGLVIGAPGPAVISELVAANTTSVKVRNMQPGYVIREGQFFNLFRADGRALLHHSTAEILVALDGTATIPILPWTRASIGVNSRVSFEPVIEGRLKIESSGMSYSFDPSRFVGITFTIEEYGSNA